MNPQDASAYDLPPSSLMKQWRPELFSDTQKIERPLLGKSQFEFHLHEITANRKEIEFEDFCRRLCEKEICPNLFVLGGPTGGGDGGVDSATYPVSPELAENRYWGGVARPTEQAWAFAFSAKEDWASKVRDDIGKIAALPRPFTKAIFVSNQPIPPKRKSQLESELTKRYKLEVTIFGRAWIVEKVFGSKHEDMAIAALHLDLPKSQERLLGPRDVRRRHKFEELLMQLRDPATYRGNVYAMATDYLEAAQLAAGLESSRPEVDGLYQQACRLALKTGYVSLIIRTHYNYAWKSFWWFDDAETASRIYSEMESYIDRIEDAHLCQLLSNLLNLLRGATFNRRILPAIAKVSQRLKSLQSRLQTLADNLRRPNNALHSKLILHYLKLYEGRYEPERFQSAFEGLEQCLKQGEALPTVPVMEWADNLAELGQMFCDQPGYDSLFRTIQRITRERKGDAEEGKQQYEYGLQLVKSGKLPKALRELGQARLKLAKEETMDQSMDAAFACAAVFHDLGLLWAAHMDGLHAAHIALYSKESVHSSPLRAVYVAMKMAWRELELGRVAPLLSWVQNVALLLDNAESLKEDTKALRDECFALDRCIGCFLLNLPEDEARELSGLEKTLAAFGMHGSVMCLSYRLGDVAALQEYLPKLVGDKTKLNEMFERWRTQPVGEQLPRKLSGETRSVCTYSTTIRGVCYTIRCRNKMGPILFAENLLGVIENFFALAKWENFAFVTEKVSIFVDEVPEGKSPPDINFEHFAHGREQRLLFALGLETWLLDHRKQAADFLELLLLKIIFASTIDPHDDIEKELAEMHREATFDRALAFSPTAVAVLDLIQPKFYDINYWLNATSAQKI
jgi:hypothetical protein